MRKVAPAWRADAAVGVDAPHNIGSSGGGAGLGEGGEEGGARAGVEVELGGDLRAADAACPISTG